MTVTSIALVDAASGVTVPILPADGVAAQVLDVAAPARAVAEDRAGAHGSFDTTLYLSAAAVSLTLLLYPGAAQHPEDFLDTIAPLLNPALRPALVVANDRWATPRQLTVRYDGISKPLSDPTNWPVQVTWSAPSGAWEDTTLTTAGVTAFIDSSTGLTVTSAGLTVTTAGLVIPATSSVSPSLVISGGTAVSQWTGLLYGPCSGPKIANDTAGGALEFTDDLVLGPGEFAQFDSATRTANRNGDPAQSLTGLLDYPAGAQWWLIQPGANQIRYYPSSAGPGSEAILSFRAAWPA